MAGTPGTARFGVNTDMTPDHTDASGVSHMTLPKNGNQWTETHFMYNPAQKSRAMGTTRGADPGHDNADVEHQHNYMCNHDGFAGGTTTVMNLDERKVLTSTIYSISCEWADPGTDETSANGWAPAVTHGAFD
jgi:hypothetical protein